jgi:hypothetical protein
MLPALPIWRTGTVGVDPPVGLAPWSSVMTGAAPVVHVVVTVPVPLSAVERFVTTGSYVPNATAAVLIVQLAEMVAVTLRLAVAVPANGRDHAFAPRSDRGRRDRRRCGRASLSSTSMREPPRCARSPTRGFRRSLPILWIDDKGLCSSRSDGPPWIDWVADKGKQRDVGPVVGRMMGSTFSFTLPAAC